MEPWAGGSRNKKANHSAVPRPKKGLAKKKAERIKIRYENNIFAISNDNLSFCCNYSKLQKMQNPVAWTEQFLFKEIFQNFSPFEINLNQPKTTLIVQCNLLFILT